MTDRSDNTRRTVARMKIAALESAAAHQRDVEAASRARRIERVASVISDLAERFEVDHGAEFDALGITIEVEDGRIVLEKSGRTFIVRPREDMTFAADGVIIPLNSDLPVLTNDIVDDVVQRVRAWAGVGVSKPKRYFR